MKSIVIESVYYAVIKHGRKDKNRNRRATLKKEISFGTKNNIFPHRMDKQNRTKML